MLLAQAAPPPRFEFATLAPWIDQPGAVTIAGLLAVVLVGVIVLLYWRERSSLSPLRMLPLLLLRLGAVLGVVLYALAPEKRDARQQTRPSRVLLLVDDSLSMALPDQTPSDSTPKLSRTQAAIDLLEERGLLDDLRRTHELHIAPLSDPRSTSTVLMLGGEASADSKDPQSSAIDYAERLKASAVETRLGDALQQATNTAASDPLAGVVLFSDGQNNAGASPELAAASLGELGVPAHTIGFGSGSPAKNLAVRDFVAPRRAYPKDELQVTVVIESQAAAGATASVSLFVRGAGDETAAPVLLESKTVGPLSDEDLASVDFAVRPEAEGQYEYRVSVTPLADEHDQTDNSATAEVQVVDRLLRVLLIAGGPTRDYHYLRDQLRRDDTFEVDVLLQSAPTTISQDANKVLSKLPTDEEELAEYDLIVAFDADWIDFPRETVEAIQRCVSQRGAGFLFATGPVNTPRWLREPGVGSVLSLLPVKPATAPVLLGSANRASPRALPIELTRAGREAAPLWVLGDQQASVAFWEQQLPGFYTTAEVDSIKPAAIVYAQAAPEQGGKPRVVFAEQFFGAGRCFYVGAPELWRLRSEDPAALRALFTKLLQHLSQGRLLANSAAGSLLFERDRYSVGDTLTLRASLSETGQPAPEKLAAQIESPDGQILSVPLERAESGGVWSAGLRAQSEGAYRASLSLPGVAEPLTAKAIVRVPALERSRTQRDAALLLQIAQQTGGHYYPTLESVITGDGDFPPLARAIPSRTETLVVYGAPDEAFAKRVAQWLLGLIAGCLLLEWTLRRFMNLA